MIVKQALGMILRRIGDSKLGSLKYLVLFLGSLNPLLQYSAHKSPQCAPECETDEDELKNCDQSVDNNISTLIPFGCLVSLENDSERRLYLRISFLEVYALEFEHERSGIP